MFFYRKRYPQVIYKNTGDILYIKENDFGNGDRYVGSVGQWKGTPRFCEKSYEFIKFKSKLDILKFTDGFKGIPITNENRDFIKVLLETI